jgi:hypothetical protein
MLYVDQRLSYRKKLADRQKFMTGKIGDDQRDSKKCLRAKTQLIMRNSQADREHSGLTMSGKRLLDAIQFLNVSKTVAAKHLAIRQHQLVVARVRQIGVPMRRRLERSRSGPLSGP